MQLTPRTSVGGLGPAGKLEAVFCQLSIEFRIPRRGADEAHRPLPLAGLDVKGQVALS